MNRFYGLVLLLFFSLSTWAQEEKNGLTIRFEPVFHDQALVLEGGNFVYQGEKIVFDALKFYISNLEFYKADKAVYADKTPQLLQLEDSASMSLHLPLSLDFDHIRFSLGIDSLTNESGALDGDLDPTKGMYWTWQSGYINFKLEGKSPLSPTRDNGFQFHLGGYLPPYPSIQTVELACAPSSELRILVDVGRFLENIDLTSQHTVMSPGKSTLELSILAKEIFSINPKK